jgi:hypothetical protein
MESLKNSEISGQRRLDEKARNRYAGKKEREQFFEELHRTSGKPAKE